MRSRCVRSHAYEVAVREVAVRMRSHAGEVVRAYEVRKQEGRKEGRTDGWTEGVLNLGNGHDKTHELLEVTHAAMPPCAHSILIAVRA